MSTISASEVLAVIAFNLTRAAATVTGQASMVNATTGTIRRTLITVPARVATSARRITLQLAQAWPKRGPGRTPGPSCSTG